MSSALQNRLVGTIIVVALVVIVLPEFLDGEKSTNQQNFLDIPARGDLVEVQPIEAMDTTRIEQALERPVEVLNESPVDEPQDTTSMLQYNQCVVNSLIYCFFAHYTHYATHNYALKLTTLLLVINET